MISGPDGAGATHTGQGCGSAVAYGEHSWVSGPSVSERLAQVRQPNSKAFGETFRTLHVNFHSSCLKNLRIVDKIRWLKV